MRRIVSHSRFKEQPEEPIFSKNTDSTFGGKTTLYRKALALMVHIFMVTAVPAFPRKNSQQTARRSGPRGKNPG
jgi:hypothetical protein